MIFNLLIPYQMETEWRWISNNKDNEFSYEWRRYLSNYPQENTVLIKQDEISFDCAYNAACVDETLKSKFIKCPYSIHSIYKVEKDTPEGITSKKMREACEEVAKFVGLREDAEIMHLSKLASSPYYVCGIKYLNEDQPNSECCIIA